MLMGVKFMLIKSKENITIHFLGYLEFVFLFIFFIINVCRKIISQKWFKNYCGPNSITANSAGHVNVKIFFMNQRWLLSISLFSGFSK